MDQMQSIKAKKKKKKKKKKHQNHKNVNTLSIHQEMKLSNCLVEIVSKEKK